jgi:uncharacterized protein
LSDCAAPPPALLVQGIAEFNRREFFICHETLETLWKQERAPVRELYQGIIQVAVGCLHQERCNYRGSVLSLERGLRRLRPLPPVCQGVAVGRLVAEADRLLFKLLELGAARIDELDPDLIPRVEVQLHVDA